MSGIGERTHQFLLQYLHMQHSRQNHYQLTVIWEQGDEPNADEVLRQVAKWIVDDIHQHSSDAPVDNRTCRTLNEDVPVENTN